MASVAMGEAETLRLKSLIVRQIAYCLYCDRCGSFNIKIAFGRRLFEVIGLVVVGFAAFWVLRDTGVAYVIGLLAVLALQLLLLSKSFWHRSHICANCGNTVKSQENTLDFSVDDFSVLDVPYDKTIRYYRDVFN